MVDRQCPGGFNYKRYKRNAALNAAFFLPDYFIGTSRCLCRHELALAADLFK
jgi:hypothetical protein